MAKGQSGPKQLEKACNSGFTFFKKRINKYIYLDNKIIITKNYISNSNTKITNQIIKFTKVISKAENILSTIFKICLIWTRKI